MKDIKKIQEFFSKPLVKNTPRIDEGKKQDHDNDDITIDPDTEFNIDLRHLIQKHKITENGSKVSNSEILDVIDSIQGLIKNLKGDNSKKSPKLFSIAGPLIRELHKLVESNNKTNPSKLKVEGKIDKSYGGGSGEVTDKKGSFVVVNKKSYHESDVKLVGESLNEFEDNGTEEKAFDAELIAAANGIAATLGKELKSKQGDKEQLDEAVVTSIIVAVLTGNALIGFISKVTAKLMKKFKWEKGEDFAQKIQKWTHDNEKAFQAPIKRVLKFFIKDPTKLENTTQAIYAVIIMSMAVGYGTEAISSLSNASWFKAGVASLKGIAKGDEAMMNTYPAIKAFLV